MDYKQRIYNLVRGNDAVLQRRSEPFRLASGEWSHWFIDAKNAVDDPDDLDLVGAAMVHAAAQAGVEIDAVGGLVLGAVPFVFAVSGKARCKWLLVRKEPKGRGTNLWIEGARVEPGMKVMLVEDVVTTAGSIKDAYDRLSEQGAVVVFASALVDRGDHGDALFARLGVPYKPMLRYGDLGIPRVGDEDVVGSPAR
jgi:orotate phosphoribosyltransferase